jgi:transcriptional regulator with XRE-family HTH domain
LKHERERRLNELVVCEEISKEGTMTIGTRIRELRTVRGLTQKDLGKIAGVGTSMIGMYEINARKPSFDVLERIADYFSVSTDYLLGRTEPDLIDDSIRTLTRDIQGLTAKDRKLLKGIVETMCERGKEARDR